MAKTGKAYSKQSVKKTGRERKEKLVAELTEKIDTTNGLVFTDYKGLTHLQLETLKRELKKDDATIIIAKNSLMKISLGNSKNYADAKDNEALVGPTATLLIKGDMVGPLKKLQKAAKEAGLPKVKFGLLEGQILDESAVIKIASLPGRETLLTQLVAMLNSPIQGFVSGLNSIPQKFVMTLDAVAKNKPAMPKVATAVQSDSSAAGEVQADKPADNAPTSAPEEKPEEGQEAKADKQEDAVENENSEKPAEEASATEDTPKDSEAEAEEKTEEKPEDESNETEEKEGGEK